MDVLFSTAMQCDSPYKLAATIVISICIITIVVALSLVVTKALNTIVTYHKVTVKIDSDSVKVESDLSR